MQLLEILSDYKQHYVGRICRVRTNYGVLSEVLVCFESTDLHHLFGFHKVTPLYATQTINLIEEGQFDLCSYEKSPYYSEVRERILLYPFIADVFIKNATDYCIVRKDLSVNSMNLDLVFFDGNQKTVTVLGLRKTKDDKFRLVTLHKSYAKKYAGVRKTKIVSIDWL